MDEKMTRNKRTNTNTAHTGNKRGSTKKTSAARKMTPRQRARERIRRKKRQMMIRRFTRLGIFATAAILFTVFLVKGIILPIADRIGGNDDREVVAQVEEVEKDPLAAIRQPLKGKSDLAKLSVRTPGWHDSADGRWYQNADGTYFSSGFQTIDGVQYSFDENGYMQTGWVTKGVNDYYFNDNGSYNPEKQRPMLALTYDDGPGEYTNELLDCLEENNAKATFFMLGQNVEVYPDVPKRMLELGCEIGTHSWDHPNLFQCSYDEVANQFTKTDDALIAACGQAATVARAPYGNSNEDIRAIVDKPFFMWSLDSLDWSYLDAEKDYDVIMNGDLTDGSIILMHDIHRPSIDASLRIIPELVEKGYKLVTLSEMAEAKGVDLQVASYSDFWRSSLDAGEVAGYNAGNNEETAEETAEITDGDSSDELSDGGSI